MRPQKQVRPQKEEELTKHLKNKRVLPVWMSKGRASPEVGAAVAKAPRQECV